MPCSQLQVGAAVMCPGPWTPLWGALRAGLCHLGAPRREGLTHVADRAGMGLQKDALSLL